MDFSSLTALADGIGHHFGEVVQGLLVIVAILGGIAIGYAVIWFGFLRHFRFIQELFGLNSTGEQPRMAPRPRQRLRKDR